MKRPLGTALIIAAITIQASFYASALHFHFWEYFFPFGAVHSRQGLDFFQVPNGAHSYWHGGPMSGKPRPGVPRYADANYNVFHPFFTLAVGTPLQWLTPPVAFRAWLALHALVNAGLALALVRRFRRHPDLPLALFLLLAAAPEALEIWNAQYHFLLGAGVFWLMLRSREPERPLFDGAVLAGTMLVKPVTALWVPTLLWKRRWWTLVVALVILEIVTLPFAFDRSALYYFIGMKQRVGARPAGMRQFFALDSLLLWMGVRYVFVRALEILTAAGIVALHWLRPLDLYRAFFLWIAFQLLFDFSFEYHYAILAPMLAVGVLTEPMFQRRSLRLCALLLITPSPFWLLHWLQIGAEGHRVTNEGFAWMVVWRIVPLITACVLMVTSKPRDEEVSSPSPAMAS